MFGSSKTSRTVAIFMTTFVVVAIGTNIGREDFLTNIIIHLGSIFGVGVAIHLILAGVTEKKRDFMNTITSLSILFLILQPLGTRGIIPVSLATTLTIFSKFFITKRGTPLLNPVAFGVLLVAGLSYLIPGLVSPGTSWWGTSSLYALGLMGIWIFIIFPVFQKKTATLTFLIVSAVYLLARGFGGGTFPLSGTIEIFTSGTIYFFASIMLVEPNSSPFHEKDQLTYGFLAALIYQFLFSKGILYFELITIIVVNIFYQTTSGRPRKPLNHFKNSSPQKSELL